MQKLQSHPIKEPRLDHLPSGVASRGGPEGVDNVIHRHHHHHHEHHHHEHHHRHHHNRITLYFTAQFLPWMIQKLLRLLRLLFTRTQNIPRGVVETLEAMTEPYLA